MIIDNKIANINEAICKNIDLIDFSTVTRGLVAQNLLSQSRNLVEHIAVKIYAQGKDTSVRNCCFYPVFTQRLLILSLSVV